MLDERSRGVADTLDILARDDGFRLYVSEKHLNRNGMVHGGVLCTLSDWAMATRALELVSETQTVATLGLDIKYLRPAGPGDVLVAAVEVINRSRANLVLECVVRDGMLRPVSKSSALYRILDRSNFESTSRVK